MASTLRVAFVLPNLSGGGAERVFVDLAAHFAARGHDTHLIVFAGGGDYQREVDSRVRMIDLGTRTTPASMLPLYRTLRELRIEVVFSTLKHVSIAVEAMRLATGKRFRHVIRAANTYHRELRALSKPARLAYETALRLAHRSADRTVCVSRGVATDLEHNFGVPANRVRVISNPVYDERMAERGRAPTGIAAFDEGRGFLVVAAGRLVPQKAFDVLIRAFAAGLDGRDAHLYILGDGPGRDELMALSASLGVGERVTLVGFVQNPFAFLSKASLFVLSSRFEGLPNVLIQALCLGTRASRPTARAARPRSCAVTTPAASCPWTTCKPWRASSPPSTRAARTAPIRRRFGAPTQRPRAVPSTRRSRSGSSTSTRRAERRS